MPEGPRARSWAQRAPDTTGQSRDLRHIHFIWGARSLSLPLESGIKWTQGGSYNANPCFFIIFFNNIIIVFRRSLHNHVPQSQTPTQSIFIFTQSIQKCHSGFYISFNAEHYPVVLPTNVMYHHHNNNDQINVMIIFCLFGVFLIRTVGTDRREAIFTK